MRVLLELALFVKTIYENHFSHKSIFEQYQKIAEISAQLQTLNVRITKAKFRIRTALRLPEWYCNLYS